MAKKNRNIIRSKDMSLEQDEQEVLGILEDSEAAAEAFLNRWEDEASPPSSDKGKEVVQEAEAIQEELDELEEDVEDELQEDEDEETDASEDEAEDAAGETDEDSEDQAQEDEPKKPGKVLEDTSEVEIKIDDEIKKVPVKDLKRLYGMEASLTKKSQQVAAQRKEVEAQTVKQAAVLDNLYKKAQTTWEPYSKIDMLVASKELDTETFSALRKEAQAAYDDFQYVSQEANNFVKQAEQQRTETLRTKAAEAIEVLKTKTDWSEELYGKIRTYASENGIPRDLFNQVVDPHAILMMNKARLFDESKKIVLKKKVKTATKVIRVGSTNGSDIITDKSTAALNRLKLTGDSEDAAEAFMARWQ